MAQVEVAGSDLRGAEFGPYKIVRRLGIGGMAETFEATRTGRNGFTQRVCLKLALPFLREEKQFVRLFEREARLAAQLRHRNIVGVLDYGKVDRTLYIALELVDGVDLLTILRAHGQLPFEYVALLAIELAEGLNHAHNLPVSAGLEDSSTRLQGIIHRDLSPSNVMLSEQGEVMLADFGVAKAMSGSSQHETAPTIVLPDGRVKGKVPYMSPEQLRNERLDGRADLFALGVLLFETLSGSRPFDGGHDPATIIKILQGEHVPLSKLAHDAPDGFCEIVDGLLASDRERRPKAASELIPQLDEFAPSPHAQQNLGAIAARLREDALQRSNSQGVSTSEHTFVRRGDALESGVSVKAESVSAFRDESSKQRRGLHVSVPLVVTIVVAILVGIFVLAARPG
jgi:serine/threonine protein kinase